MVNGPGTPAMTLPYSHLGSRRQRTGWAHHWSWALSGGLAFALLIMAGALTEARAQSIGSYFTLVNTYIYSQSPRQGARTLVRPRVAFAVVDLTLDRDERIWYRIIHPDKTNQVQGEGWTARAPHQLRGNPLQQVLVFERIPTNSSIDLPAYRVPIAGLELLNESQASLRFSQLNWQKVRFRLTEPLRAWARGSAGLFRAGKSKTFLSRVYGEMVTRNVDKEKRLRLLSGVVRIGDTLRETTWAMGDPLRRQEENIGNTQRIIWQFPEMTVVFENEVVKQIE